MPQPKLLVLDLDSTLTNTSLIFDTFATVFKETQEIDVQQLYDARATVEESGGSYDVLKTLQAFGFDEAGKNTISAAFLKYVADNQVDFLYADARALLETVTQQQIPTMILTYGDVRWQTLKLQAAGLAETFPVMITDKTSKGSIIAEWRTPAGTYSLPTGVSYASVVLVDDKRISFEGLPEDCVGYWRPLRVVTENAPLWHVQWIEKLTDIIPVL